MTTDRLVSASERWFRLLLRLYPEDFRGEMGEAFVEAYRDKTRAAQARGGVMPVLGVWFSALRDSMQNGPGERARPAVRWRRGGNWGRDTELVVRRLLRAPLFVISMVGTLAVGLSAFAVVFAVVHGVLLAPLPYESPDDLYYVWRDYTAFFDLDRGWLGGTDVAELAKTGGVIEDIAGMRQQSVTFTGAAGTEPNEVSILVTTPNLFDVLGVQPVLGRGFRAEDGGDGRAGVVVLTHELWNRFGADPAMVGTDVRIDGMPYTVIGVLGRDFNFVRNSSLGPPARVEAYATFDFEMASTNPGAGSYAGVMRVKPGTDPAAVEAAVAAVGRTIDERDFESRGLKLYPVGLQADLVAGVKPALTVLGFAGVFLLLALMVNLATLLLVRATQREREFAVARALGANRFALVRATLLEGGVLGLLGGAVAAVAAVWGTRMLVSLAPLDLPRRESIVVNWQVALVVLAVGAALGLLAGAVPAIWATKTKLASLLGNAAVRGGGGHGSMRRVMVVVQVALSVVLLTTGGLVVRSFDRLLSADPGFDAANVLTFRIPVSAMRYPNDTVAIALHNRVQTEIAALPGVTAVGAASALPFSDEANQTTIGFPSAPGNTGDEDADRPLVDHMTIRPGYLESMRIEVLEGSDFGTYAPPSHQEVLIDRTLAAQFFPGSSAVGAWMMFQGDTAYVKGVVDHARLYDVHSDGRQQVYLRNDAYTFYSLFYTVRTSRDPAALIPEVRSIVRGIDPELALAAPQPMQSIVQNSLRQQRISAVLIGGFALGALLLAGMGLFGVVSGSVTRRRHEIAVRLALGADHGRVLRLMLSEGVALIVIGLLVGVPGVYFAGQVVRGVLVGVSPFDPATLTAVVVGLSSVALLACYLPARRVAAIQPARSLRQE